jgi:hypothetical protein
MASFGDVAAIDDAMIGVDFPCHVGWHTEVHLCLICRLISA